MLEEEEGGHFSGFSGLSGFGKKLPLADLAASRASSIRREGGQATYAADEKIEKEREKSKPEENKRNDLLSFDNYKWCQSCKM